MLFIIKRLSTLGSAQKNVRCAQRPLRPSHYGPHWIYSCRRLMYEVGNVPSMLPYFSFNNYW